MHIRQLAIAFGLCISLLMAADHATAQNGTENDVSIDVSARVISTIEMVTLQSMSLRDAEERNGMIRVNPRQNSNAGKMMAIGTPNSDVRISFLPRRELTRTQGTEQLLFSYNVAVNTEEEQSTAEILNQENRDFSFNEEGRLYLWIGGNVDISTATPGNYRGEFTLDIEYI
jgi:hypothetical protein